MNKNEYFAKASEYFMIGTVLLIATKILSMFLDISNGNFDKAAKLNTSATNVVFYIFLVLAFVALNGEGIGHKRERNKHRKKITGRLKWLIAFNVFFVFIKAPLNTAIAESEKFAASGVLLRLGVSAFISFGSLSFFLLVISLWYFLRDRKESALFIVQTVAVFISICYFLFKTANLAINSYGVVLPSEVLTRFIASPVSADILCLLQYIADIVMFAVVKRYYSARAAEADENEIKRTQRAFKTVSLYEERGFGIDECDDTWLGAAAEPETSEISE